MLPLAPLSLLARVPIWAWALAALLAWGGYHRWQAIGAKAEHKQAQERAALERSQADTAAATEHARRLTAQTEISNEAIKQAESNRQAAVAATNAAGRLRQRIAAVQADAARRDPASAAGCQAAITATDMLADVQRRIDEAAGQLAQHADDARTAGSACERAYEALTPGR